MKPPSANIQLSIPQHSAAFILFPLSSSSPSLPLPSFLLTAEQGQHTSHLWASDICFADCLGLFGVADGRICSEYLEMHLKLPSDEDYIGIYNWSSLRGRCRKAWPCGGWSDGSGCCAIHCWITRERERERESCRFMGPTTFKWRRHKKCRYFLLAGTI